MNKLTLTQAMADYHAVRRGVYDYSAISKDGSLVVSCWGQLLKDLGNGFGGMRLLTCRNGPVTQAAKIYSRNICHTLSVKIGP